jgi:hypothetical protein
MQDIPPSQDRQSAASLNPWLQSVPIALITFLVVLVGGLIATPKPYFNSIGSYEVFPIGWSLSGGFAAFMSLGFNFAMFGPPAMRKVPLVIRILLAVFFASFVCEEIIHVGVEAITSSPPCTGIE